MVVVTRWGEKYSPRRVSSKVRGKVPTVPKYEFKSFTPRTVYSGPIFPCGENRRPEPDEGRRNALRKWRRRGMRGKAVPGFNTSTELELLPFNLPDSIIASTSV